MRWLVCAWLWLALPISAAANDDRHTDVARTLGEEGVALFKAGRYREALELLRRAEELHHAPTLVVYMARCEDKLGHLLKAKQYYVDLLYEAEELPANPPPQYARAVEEARQELEALEPRIPALTLVVRGIKAATAQATVDGAAIGRDAWQSIPLDPGNHSVEVHADGTAAIRRTVTLVPGKTSTLELDMNAPPPKAKQNAEPSLLPAVLLFGFGGAALIVGAATGGAHLVRVADLKTRCSEDGHCPESDAEAADEAERLAIVSTTFFAVGGAAVVAGAIVLGVTLGSTSESATLLLHPTGFALHGTF